MSTSATSAVAVSKPTPGMVCSSASRRRLGAISKQGDVYLRTLLVQAARSVLWRARVAPQPTGFQRWARSTQQRRGHNIAAVAVANKLARIAWAVWSTQRPFTAERPAPDRDTTE